MENLVLNTKINLPELRLYRKTVKGNSIIQLAEQKHLTDVDVYFHSRTSFKMVDDLGREIYLKLPGSRATISPNSYIIKAIGISDITQLNDTTKLKWESHIRAGRLKSPAEILASWSKSFTFKNEDVAANAPGLRKPQMGALHAIAAHWSVKTDCATIVMPTGTGKTEVMLSVLISESCEKLLVVVPSESLRGQIHDKFIGLGRLEKMGVISSSIQLPRVAFIKHGVKRVEDIDLILEESNVLVATASALNGFSEPSLMRLAAGCSHVFFDEAHHTPAPTWNKIKSHFSRKPILQFTATPFRRDGKKIEGRFIYDYPLGLAQDNKYFKEINLVKISEIEASKADLEIAKRAVLALSSDLAAGKDHILMARAKSIERAKLLLEIYKDIASEHNPITVHYGLKAPEKRDVHRQLHSRETRIIICVDMLGEGYDLPNLKIAAIHDIHKNLTTTLQFVGRFTRTAGDSIGNATVVVNIAEPEVNKSLADLYSENPDWNKILRQKSESTIQKEKNLQEIIQNFNGELSKEVSLWNLRPSFSAFAYETNCENWFPESFKEILPLKYNYWSGVNSDEKVLIFVISKEDEVKWGNYRDIKNLSFELCIAYWDSENNRLFIQCSDYDALNCDRLAQLLCGDEAKVINGPTLFNLFSGINHPIVRNLGASKAGSISFTMYFGSEVTRGLSEIDKAESVPNNIFGWGYEGGDRVTYGCSSKTGKLWSQGGGSIVDWKEWCGRIGQKLADSDENEADIIKGFLRSVPLNGRHESVAIDVEWGEKLISAPENRVYIYFGEMEVQLFDVGLEIIRHSSNGPIYILFSFDHGNAEYRIEYISNEKGGSCTYEHISGPVISIRKYSGLPLPLAEYLIKDPLQIRYADGSFSYGNYHVSPPNPEAFYDKESLEVIEWTVDIHSESEGKERKADSVQHQVIESIMDDYDIIINDDGSYEAADIIAFKRDSSDSYTLHLIHCKFSKTSVPGADIGNMYELCGQAQKCIRWKHSGIDLLINHIKMRDEKWKKEGYTRFVKGNMSQLLDLRKFSRYAKMNFEVSIFQPGLSKEKVTPDIVQLLGCTENYLVKTSEAVFRVICSE